MKLNCKHVKLASVKMKLLLFVALMGVAELAKGIQYFDSIRTGFVTIVHHNFLESILFARGRVLLY